MSLLSLAGGLALLAIPSVAIAANPLVDESARAFTLSVAPHISVGSVIAPVGTTAPVGLTVGVRVGGQPTWYSGLYLDGGVLAGLFAGETSIYLIPDTRPPPSVAVPYVAPMAALRPWSGIELTGGPVIGAYKGPILGVIGRFSFLFPLKRFRFGPGVEVSHVSGDDLRLTIVSAVFTFELPIISRDTR